METGPSKATSTLCEEYARELREELRATRECLREAPTDKPDWKPHERSMPLGYLLQLLADMPRWMQFAIEKGEVDFATYPQFKGTSTGEMVAHLEEGVEGVSRALAGITDDDLMSKFVLRHGEQVLMESSLKETLSSTINHIVHHRGQLTVYMRLLDRKIPSIYGPSADSGGFETEKK